MRFVAGVLLFLLCCFPQPALPLSTDEITTIRDPSRREAGEVVAHMGIVKVEESIGQNGRKMFLIHASGNKRRGSSVKKVPLDAYIVGMQHVGAQVSRFTERSP